MKESQLVNARLVTAPTSEPITLAEAKAHCRVDTTADDALITSLIVGAREEFENQADKILFTSTYKLVLDNWIRGAVIELPRAKPLQSVTSITYKLEDGTTPTLSTDNYKVDVDAWPGRIVLDDDGEWPSDILYETGAITITYVAGHENTADIPQRYKQAILLLVGHWYEQREAIVITGAVPQSIPFGFADIARSAKWEER